MPLSFLFDPANRRPKEAFWRGHMRRYEVYDDFEGHMVWGVTARIVASLQEALTGP